ncbi:MAG: signal peptidase II [Actinomycetota bacterium]
MRARLYIKLLSTAGAVLVVDQVTKSMALEALDRPKHLIDGWLSLRLTYNSGGAFGLLQGLPGLFAVATIVAAVLILVWVRHIEDQGWTIPLGLVLGGGLGNVFDRLVRDTGGRVVDFIDFHFWPVFNVADVCIVTGVLLVLLFGSRSASEPGHG